MSTEDNSSGHRLSRRQFLGIAGGVAVGTLALASGAAWLGRGKGKSEIEIHRDEIVAYQELSRPKIEELLAVGDYDRCCRAMLGEYDQFVPNLPAISGSKNKSTFYASAPFMLSLYRALRGEFALDQATALGMLGQITNHKVRVDWEGRGLTRFVMARAAESEFFRNLAMKGFDWGDEEPYGWTAEFPESEACIAVDVTRCGLVRWFGEQGVPEIAPVACQGDYVWAEFMTGLELQRTQTLAEGGALCDFRYVRV